MTWLTSEQPVAVSSKAEKLPQFHVFTIQLVWVSFFGNDFLYSWARVMFLVSCVYMCVCVCVGWWRVGGGLHCVSTEVWPKH